MLPSFLAAEDGAAPPPSGILVEDGSHEYYDELNDLCAAAAEALRRPAALALKDTRERARAAELREEAAARAEALAARSGRRGAHSLPRLRAPTSRSLLELAAAEGRRDGAERRPALATIVDSPSPQRRPPSKVVLGRSSSTPRMTPNSSHRRASLARGGADGGRLEVKMAKLLWKTKDMSEVRGSVMEA